MKAWLQEAELEPFGGVPRVLLFWGVHLLGRCARNRRIFRSTLIVLGHAQVALRTRLVVQSVWVGLPQCMRELGGTSVARLCEASGCSCRFS